MYEIHEIYEPKTCGFFEYSDAARPVHASFYKHRQTEIRPRIFQKIGVPIDSTVIQLFRHVDLQRDAFLVH